MSKERLALEWFWFLGYVIVAALIGLALDLPLFLLISPEIWLFLAVPYIVVRITIWSFQTLKSSESQPLILRLLDGLSARLKSLRPMSRRD